MTPDGKGEQADDSTVMVSSTVYRQVHYDKGQSVGRYVILGKLGAGGTAVVYSAYDPELDRKVAIKVIAGDHPSGTEATHATSGGRLLHEAKALAKLSHPNVLPVFDVGTTDEGVFIAMEHVDGGTMAQWIAAKPRTWREVLAHYLEAGRGLAAAHAAGFVHRDFKPQNVLVGEGGKVRVMDFGLARRSAETEPIDPSPQTVSVSRTRREAESLTTQGVVRGTLPYMPPEQHMGSDVDARADQFSFCAALYHGIYGVRPFPPGSAGELLAAKQEARLAPGSPAIERQVPRWLRNAIIRGLRPDPDERWPSMDALLRVLERDRRTWKRTAAGVTLAGVMGAGGAVYADQVRKQDQICTGAADQMAETWNDGRKRTIEGAFLKSKRPSATDTWTKIAPILDAYASRWTEMHTDACEDTQIRKEQSSSMMDLRMACLEERRWAMDALMNVFAEADGRVVDRAVPAVEKLPALDGCADLKALSEGDPVPPDLKKRVADLRRKLANVTAREDAGLPREGLELVVPIVEEARMLDHPPVLAEVLSLQGRLHFDIGECKEAEPLLTEASWRADAGGEVYTSARTKSELSALVGFCLHRPAEAEVWSQAARGLIKRLNDPRVEVSHLNSQAVIAMGRGDHERVEDLLNEALSIQRPLAGGRDLNTANLYDNVAVNAIHSGAVEEGLEAANRAVELKESILGPMHTAVGFTVLARMNHFMRHGEYERAEADGRRAQTILTANLGEDGPYLAMLYHSLGLTLMHKGSLDEALDLLQKELVLARKHDPEGIGEIRALSYLGRCHELKGDVAKSLDHNARAVELSAKLGLEHAETVEILGNLGRNLVAMKQYDEGIELLEKAVNHIADSHRPNGDVALTRFTLAQALWQTGGDRKRAVELAAQAARQLREDVPESFYDEARSEIAAWLVVHRD